MEINVIIGIVCTGLGAVLSYAGFTRTKAKDDQASGQQSGVMLTEIGYIKANTDEIKAEQKEQRRTNMEFASRLSAVESSAKQAHHRIDRIEGKADE